MQPVEVRGQQVLVVDDEPLIRWSLAETLTTAGYRVSEAADGRSAIRILEELDDHIQVVLLDYRLPDSSDLQLLSRVRALAPHAAVILMTAYGSPELAREALAQGALRVVHKPFDMRTARTLVEQAASQP
jgi:DNA-binding NtrC family response regulator